MRVAVPAMAVWESEKNLDGHDDGVSCNFKHSIPYIRGGRKTRKDWAFS